MSCNGITRYCYPVSRCGRLNSEDVVTRNKCVNLHSKETSDVLSVTRESLSCLPPAVCLLRQDTDACFLQQDQGGCQNYTMVWFYDTKQNECSRFWYGGCDGNENRFTTQEECEHLCVTKSR
uniref:BPTI/Kunitz inhibitor domain-containing protein n=1 Tax=Sparus aurata TaxID=8175 RepID=A0A671X011_SPAAU